MIHLVAGDSALGTLKETSIPGGKFSIDDILMEGPIIDGLKTEESWIARADYLGRFSIPKEQYLSGREKRDQILADSLSHDQVVLWFEFDLHCQANLLYYLDWYASHDLGKTRLMLICPEKFPGRPTFRGLGELRREEMESLFPARTEVTADQKRIAQQAWRCFASDDPRTIEQFIRSDNSALPLVAPAMHAHLERFPSTTNGLGVVSRKTLEVLDEQPLPFRKLFPRVSATPEMFRHGMGDLTHLAYLDMLASGPSPLISKNGDVEITETGRRVLENKADAVELNGIDMWYGGVHLTPDNLVRWNQKEQKLES
jgi:Domain of unknown function (DUF1835)